MSVSIAAVISTRDQVNFNDTSAGEVSDADRGPRRQSAGFEIFGVDAIEGSVVALDSLPLPKGIEAQTRKVIDNLQRALAGVGAGFEHVVCMRIFLTDFV